jgi:hypothetical protein
VQRPARHGRTLGRACDLLPKLRRLDIERADSRLCLVQAFMSGLQVGILGVDGLVSLANVLGEFRHTRVTREGGLVIAFQLPTQFDDFAPSPS